MVKKLFLKSLTHVLTKLSPSRLKRLLIIIAKLLSIKGENFITYVERPKRTNEIKVDPLGITYENVSIVIQGPVVFEEDFTYETVKLYFKTFPKVTIILSTWDDLSGATAADFEKLGVIVVLNKKPADYGTCNINLQLVSTLNGLKMAQEAGKEFAVKTRTDQRLYNPFFLSSLKLLSQFPITVSNKPTNSRLIVSSMSSLKYRPFGVTDMLMLGRTEDMIKYWDAPLDTRKVEFEHDITVKEYAKMEIAETYILYSFLKRNNLDREFTLFDTWAAYANYFIILDKSSFNIFWFKYSIEKENRLDFYEEHIYKEMTFFEWIDLKNVKHIPELMIDKKMQSYNP
jgi:hypothetical protein